MIQGFHTSSVSNKGNRHSTSKSEDLSKHTISSSIKHNLRHPFVIILHNIIESCAFQTVMSILTLYILFADDIKILTTDVNADIPFSIIRKDFIADDEDFAFMRNPLDKKFHALYNEAFDEFQFGDWNKAKELFEQLLDTNDDDGPSQYLYDILEQNNFERPLDWEGNKLIN